MKTVAHYLHELAALEPDAPLLMHAVEDVVRSVEPTLHEKRRWQELKIVERLCEPDRQIVFRVDWIDDEGTLHVERGFRVQQSNLLGPYKGGIRFHPSVDRVTLRFLAFEQSFKNALTGLPLGGGKGGATFDPDGRTEGEVMRFCQAFMRELGRHIGPDLDVPAGDMGVGGREIGFLLGAYRRLGYEGAGALTGKPVEAGGIPLRTEATGYGLIYLVEEALHTQDASLEGMRCAISGAGNVALHAAEKLLACGALVVSLSDTSGTGYFPEGLRADALARIVSVKAEGGRLRDCVEEAGGRTVSGSPWQLECDIALPCATQHELKREDAEALVRAEIRLVAEGANMPCTPDASRVLRESRAIFLPGKAANAGGVAVSGMEMAQNAQRVPWDRERVDAMLRETMSAIHARCVEYGTHGGRVDYVDGANIAAFRRLAQSMEAQGVG